MHLDDQGDLSVFEALDHPHFPERTVAVQLSTDDVGHEIPELAHAARRGEGGAAEVIVDVEFGVVDPDRMAETQRYLDQTALEDGHLGNPVDDELANPAIRITTGHGRRIENAHHGHVHVQRRRLHVQETGVEPGQSLRGHRISSIGLGFP